LVAFAVCTGLLNGCVAANLGKYCKGAGFANVASSSLAVVLGAPADRITDLPIVSFYSPTQAEPKAILQLNLTPAAMHWPADLDETPCKGLDWRTFRVEIEPEEWKKFWSLPRPMPAELGIAAFDSMAPLRKTEFGIAIVDTAAGRILMSCGCYWT
jgi:hypothetical protein